MDVGLRKRVRAGSLLHEIALEYLRADGEIPRRILRIEHAQRLRLHRDSDAWQQAGRDQRDSRSHAVFPHTVLFHVTFLSPQ